MITKDKWSHFKAGALIALVMFFVLLDIGVIWSVALVWSVIVSSIAGVAKEVYDSMHPDKHSVDIMDWCFTAWGGLAMAVLIGLIFGFAYVSF